MGARFLPLARVPAYVACGYFKVSYAKFCAVVAFSALIYTAVIFALCHYLGEMVGDKIELMLPLTALTLIIVFGLVFWWRKRRQS